MSRGPDRAVILAGGGGTRLWPWTSPVRPKPLLPLGGAGRTLLGATIDRLGGLIGPSDVRVLATEALGRVLLAGEPRLAAEQLWFEPSPRDTGPAVALAMRRLWHERRDAVAVVLPADHRIADEPAFRAALEHAAEGARAGELVLLGITPAHASTRFGYLEPGAAVAGAAARRRVARFVEKPQADLAAVLCGAGALWNGGIFVWQADAFWDALERHAPDVAGPVRETVDGGDAAPWERVPRISIDYALMEKAGDVTAVALDAGWDDVGGWDAVLDLAARGEAGPARVTVARGSAPGSVVLTLDGAPPRDAIALGDGPLLVVNGPEGLLVTPRERADEVKKHV